MTCLHDEHGPCPVCAGLDNYIPETYGLKTLEQIKKELRSAMDNQSEYSRPARLNCVFLSVLDLIRYIEHEENGPINDEIARMREVP